MDASQNSDDALHELELLLSACDICSQSTTNAVGTNCGHVFCWPCLNEAFQREPARPCPVCATDLREESVHDFPIHDAHEGSNACIVSTPPAGMRLNVRSNARMDVVQDYLDDKRDRTHTMQLDLNRRLIELKGERIRALEQVVENLIHMNLALLRQVKQRDRRIAELENPTFGMPQRRFGSEEEYLRPGLPE